MTKVNSGVQLDINLERGRSKDNVSHPPSLPPSLLPSLSSSVYLLSTLSSISSPFLYHLSQEIMIDQKIKDTNNRIDSEVLVE